MAKTKIEWADEVWNPVWGCRNECPYCYARKIAKRFGVNALQKSFVPQWVDANFERRFAKGTKRVFVNSMSDVQFWSVYWWKLVLDRIAKFPEIDFIFLTKGDVNVYAPHLLDMSKNCILGYTVTSRKEFMERTFVFWINNHRVLLTHRLLLNVEPIQGDFGWHIDDILQSFDWVILGAETGNRKDKVIPDAYWMDSILNTCTNLHIPLFVKPSLKGIVGDEFYRKEYPASLIPSDANPVNELTGGGK